jgi:signal transduction histidine kinase
MDVTAQIDHLNPHPNVTRLQSEIVVTDPDGATTVVHTTKEETERLAVMVRDLEREIRKMGKTIKT